MRDLKFLGYRVPKIDFKHPHHTDGTVRKRLRTFKKIRLRMQDSTDLHPRQSASLVQQTGAARLSKQNRKKSV